MKLCAQCGAMVADEYTVCPACGMVLSASQPAQETQPVEEAPQAPYVPPVYVPPTTPVANYAPVEAPKASVSMWGWVGRYALNLIPFVGGLVYFIMLFVWAFDSKYDETSRNWAKAQLIIGAVAVILLSLLVMVLVALGISAYDVMQESMYY